MSKYLLLRLRSPLQSWGGESFSYNYRSTVRHPTLSGVLGLISCSLGINSSNSPSFTETLVDNISMDVFCYTQGSVLKDYQTAGVGHSDLRKVPTKYNGEWVEAKVRGNVSKKEYLQSSDFCVILKVESDELAESIVSGLKSPKWMPSLGRKACIPTVPVFIGESTSREEIEGIMSKVMSGSGMVYSVVADDSGEALTDVPVEFNRKYRSRKVLYSDANNF